MKKIRTKKASGHSALQARLEPLPTGPTMDEVVDLAIDVWKVTQRAKVDGAGDRILVACERAEDRLRRIGFEIDAMVGRNYDTNLHVRVVDHDPADGPMIIGRCISPAVFYRGVLVKEAEVVTAGGEETR